MHFHAENFASCSFSKISTTTGKVQPRPLDDVEGPCQTLPDAGVGEAKKHPFSYANKLLSARTAAHLTNIEGARWRTA